MGTHGSPDHAFDPPGNFLLGASTNVDAKSQNPSIDRHGRFGGVL